MKIKNFVICLLSIFLTNIISLQAKAQTLSELLAAEADIIVAQDGSEDYTTIQAAIGAIPDNNDTWKVILVKKGLYKEKVVLSYLKTKVILVGEQVDSTIISWDDYGDIVLPGHTFSSYTFRADANDFQAYNINFDNPATAGQGVAFHSNGDRQILYHCKLTGNQDTYFDNFRTRRYIKDCFIEGGVDYIFGFGVTLFDSCQIHTNRADGYITAASTPEHYEFGYVFKDCRLTSTPGLSGIYLGRPWFPHSNTIFFECWEPESIKSTGWKDWSGREATCLYKEYNCFGPGSDTTERVYFGKQLNPALASRYNIDTILSANNFPSDLGYTVDTTELMVLYRRFEESGYTDRADTILYAGRASYPTYPTDDWSPEFYSNIHDIINNKTYRFMDSVNSQIVIEDLLWDGNSMENFNPEVADYHIEIPSDHTDTVDFEVVGDGINTVTDYPSSTPGYAYITATAYDKTTGINFSIYISQDSAWWRTDPLYAIINSKDTVFMKKNKFQYYIDLSDGDTKVKTLRTVRQFPGQLLANYKPAELPGEAYVGCLAPNGIDTATYTISVNYFLAINEDKLSENKVIVSNPIENAIILISNSGEEFNLDFKLYDLSGKLVFEENNVNINSTKTEINLGNAPLPGGVYIYNILDNNGLFSGKLVKTK